MATTKTLAPTNQTITIAAFQGEKPDQRQIADAEGKMADAINALNSHIEAHWFGNNTLANIQTAMVSFAQDVPDGGVRSIEFGISQATGNFGATNYIGKLERISASRLCVTVMNAMYATNMVIGNYKDGTWNWAEVALTSQLDNVPTKIAQSVASNATYELSIEDNHSYLITHMTSSDESTRVILISRRATYVRKFELASGSWQSYYTETVANNKWTFANGSYVTMVNIIDF